MVATKEKPVRRKIIPAPATVELEVVVRCNVNEARVLAGWDKRNKDSGNWINRQAFDKLRKAAGDALEQARADGLSA